jgi:Fur family ferric uptake transcriptional regulator
MNDYRLKLLKEKGYRTTLSRQAIFEALTSYPQSVKEIHRKLNGKKDFSVDLATVYRTLEFFFSEGIVTKSQFDLKGSKYELNNADNHHHHFICENCGIVEDFSVNDSFFLRKITSKSDFTVKRHTLELWGLCSKCARKKSR